MRYNDIKLSLMVVLILTLVSNGCSSSQPNGNEESQTALPKKLVIEITTEASQTIYPKGKTLDLRLFDNQEAEFDFYPPNTPDQIGKPFTSEIRIGKVGNAEFEALSKLLEQSDLSEAESSYTPSKRGLDAFVKKTLILVCGNKQKTIILEERDSHLHLAEKVGLYPASLIRLLEMVEQINVRLRKEIDSQSR